ncbi:MAG: 16S rRNA (cytosine(967)-C(5))-methyltransferase RsmB [Methylococcales bacterium]|nr:16S rRNA (cytosine(967)-C(5))-methyltransferase RsmB [Methylococcales bacterium]
MNLRKPTTQILLRVLKEGRSLTNALDKDLAPLDTPQDKAFVQALCYGVLRDYHRLDFIVTLLLSKPLRNKDHDIKILILMGIYQLRTMRVKPHAAVSETVAAVGKKSWAKKLINGVLRQYIREQQTLEQQIEKNPVANYSHPQWLIDCFKKDWGQQAVSLFEQNNHPAPMVLRVNLTQSTQTDYQALLAQQDFSTDIVAFTKTALVLKQAVMVDQLPYFKNGWVSVQDTAAQLAAPLLQLQKNQRVLDLCAAPGGKTAAILELEPSVKMTALDIDATRVKRIRENLQRLKLSATLITADASDFKTWWDGTFFDRVLVDAPCSALGVIRHHPDIKLLRRESDIEALVKRQAEILDAAWTVLAVGGILLYATCSLLKQENQTQIESFLKQHSDGFEIPIEAEWGIPQTIGRQILTGDQTMDGFYYARLGKNKGNK